MTASQSLLTSARKLESLGRPNIAAQARIWAATAAIGQAWGEALYHDYARQVAEYAERMAA